MSSSEILKTNFFCQPLLFPQGFNPLQDFVTFLLSKRAQRISYTVRVVPEAYVLKLSIFVAQRLDLHQNGVTYGGRHAA